MEDLNVPVAGATGGGRKVAVAGAGLALFGHLLTVGAFHAGIWVAGGYREDTDYHSAGAGFGRTLYAMTYFVVAQFILFTICVPLAAYFMQRRPAFGRGLLVGWIAGGVVLLAGLAWAFYAAGRGPDVHIR